jgi:hypothetical protein
VSSEHTSTLNKHITGPDEFLDLLLGPQVINCNVDDSHQDVQLGKIPAHVQGDQTLSLARRVGESSTQLQSLAYLSTRLFMSSASGQVLIFLQASLIASIAALAFRALVQRRHELRVGMVSNVAT